MWSTPKLLDGLNCKSKGEDNGRKRSQGALPGLQHFGDREVCWSSEMGIKKIDKQLNYSHRLAQTKQQVGLCIIATLWCMDEPWANTDEQDSPQPKLRGSHHLLPYSILYAWP